MKITGSFEIKLSPMEGYAQGENGINLGRMSIEKTFAGELSATSKGEMLSAMTTVKGSAGYVAIEQVEGVLTGKKGSFVLQHSASMQGEKQLLMIEIVPDSATDELTGMSGKMKISIKDGQHYYELEYEL